jgi:predicted RNase H-like HicB family nuclease
MKITYQSKPRSLNALIWKETESAYVARCIEVEIASQGKTKNEALHNLQEAVELYFESEGVELRVNPFYNISVEPFKITCA